MTRQCFENPPDRQIVRHTLHRSDFENIECMVGATLDHKIDQSETTASGDLTFDPTTKKSGIHHDATIRNTFD